MDRLKIRDILKKRDIELHIAHDDTKLEDVASKLGPLMGQAAFVAPFMGIIRDAYARTGMKSSTQKSETYSASYEKVVAATALSINRVRLDLQEMLDIDKGAYFEIALAANMASGEGHIEIMVEEGERTTQVTAKSEIPGQKMAWGRGTTALQGVFDAIAEYLKILPD